MVKRLKKNPPKDVDRINPTVNVCNEDFPYSKYKNKGGDQNGNESSDFRKHVENEERANEEGS